MRSKSAKKQKNNNRRKKIIKRRLFITLFMLFTVGIITLCILCYTKFFPIKKVTVKGNSLYESREIVAVSGINTKTPILSVTEGKLNNRILKKLPYIESVKLKKRFPDSVTVTVKETSDYYAFKTDNGYYTVSQNGRVLSECAEPAEDLLLVKTESAQLDICKQVEFKQNSEQQIFDVLSSLPDSLNVRVNEIDLTDKMHISVIVDSRLTVNFGTSEYLEEKIRHLAGMIAEIGDRKGSINLEMWSKSDSKGTFIAEN